jgi:hypothetical protein
MSESEFQKIMEAVNQGIVASKQSDSKFWGEWKEWRKDKDNKDEIMHDTLIRLSISVENLVEREIIRNGRLEKAEKKLENFGKIVSYSKGVIAVGSILIGVVMTLGAFIYLKTDNDLEKLTTTVNYHIQNEQLSN